MNIDNLIQELEYNYKKGFEDKQIVQNCINIIDKIFFEITSNDEFFNLFIKELNKDFIIYFKNLVNTSLSKNIVVDKNADNLIKNKFSVTSLDNKIVKKIKELISQEVKILKKNEDANKVSRSDLTISGGIKILRLISILNKEFSKNGHLDSVSNYLGYKSSITGLAIELSSKKTSWWKHKSNHKEPQTLAVHLDKEFSCIKSILYLTDVKEDNGPFTVYPNVYESLNLNLFQNILGRIIHETALNTKNLRLKKFLNIEDRDQPLRSENFRKIYDKLPVKTAFNSAFGWDIKKGSNDEDRIINSENKILGEIGTLITFDGSKLLHRGGLVKEDSRIVFQIIYSKKISNIKFLLSKILNKIK